MMSTPKFEKRLSALQGSLLQFALMLTHTQDDAYALLSKTTSSALARKPSYDEGRDFRGWVFRLMREEYLSKYRPEPLEIDEEARLPMVCDEALPAPYGAVEISEFQASLRHLPKGERRVYGLHVSGYRPSEIADLLDISVIAVKRIIYLASRKL